MFPRFFFNGSVINLGTTTQTPGTAPFDSYDLFADIIKTVGLHSLKFGVDSRKFQKGNFTFGNSCKVQATSALDPCRDAESMKI
jgi:hypothetical protein